MKKKRLLLLMLSLVLASGLLMGTGRIVSKLSLLDMGWYEQVESRIHYIDRLTEQINDHVAQLSIQYEIYKPNYKDVFVASDTLSMVQQRTHLFLQMLGENNTVDLKSMSEELVLQIEWKVDLFLKAMTPYTHHLTPDVLAEYRLAVIDCFMINILNPYLDVTKEHAPKVIEFLCLMTSSASLIYIVISIVGSLCMILFLHRDRVSKKLAYISLSFLIAGTSIHIWEWIKHKEAKLRLNELTFLQYELAYAAFKDMIHFVLLFGKIMLLVSLVVLIMAYIIKCFFYGELTE